MKKHVLILLTLCFTVISKSQMSSTDYGLLQELDKSTINVELFDITCKRCEVYKEYNEIIKNHVEEFIHFGKGFKYIDGTEENNDKKKKRKKKKNIRQGYYLEIETASAKTRKNALGFDEVISWRHSIELSKESISKNSREEIIFRWFVGENGSSFGGIAIDIMPLVLKTMNTFIKDAKEYKTLKPSVIAEKNWSKIDKIESLQIYRGFLRQKTVFTFIPIKKEEEAFTTAFSVPLNLIGFNEMLNIVYQKESTENKLFIFPNIDGSKKKFGERGRYYYFVDLNTGKLMKKVENKGFNPKYFVPKDLEILSEVVNNKNSSSKKTSSK